MRVTGWIEQIVPGKGYERFLEGAGGRKGRREVWESVSTKFILVNK